MESRVAGRAYLAGVAKDASLGSLRLQCPFCDGGPEREVSLVLTMREDGSFYCCHRASCGARGVIGPKGRAISLGELESKNPRTKEHEPYRGSMVSMNFNWPIAHRYLNSPLGDGVTCAAVVGLFMDKDGSMEVWRLQTKLGTRIGVQTRYRQGGKKIVKTYKETPGPMYHYLHRDHADLWIVEDPLSAAVAYSHGVSALALLGTYLSPELATILAADKDVTGNRCINVALDPGAEEAATRVARTLQSVVVQPVRVIPLRTDLKDMSLERVSRLIHWGDL